MLGAEAATRCWRAVLDRRDGVPGVVASIQTFGEFGANWNPHFHALATDGSTLPGGEFVPLPGYDETLERLLTETFRGPVLRALRKEERISETFLESLSTWRHGRRVSAPMRVS